MGETLPKIRRSVRQTEETVRNTPEVRGLTSPVRRVLTDDGIIRSGCRTDAYPATPRIQSVAEIDTVQVCVVHSAKVVRVNV